MKATGAGLRNLIVWIFLVTNIFAQMPPGSGGGGTDIYFYTNSYTPPDYGTNLWLEITNVSDCALGLWLHNTQPDVPYQLLSKETLLDTQWLSEGFVWGSETTNLTPASVGMSNRPSLFLQAEGLPDYMPSIMTQPADQTVIQGNNATFSVTVTGSTLLSYQWYFNGTNQLIGATNCSLVLTNVQSTNQGYYLVVITNFAGSVTSAVAELELACDPPPSGIISWWPGNGDSYDYVNANDGVLQGGVSYTNGVVGQAFSFDGGSGGMSVSVIQGLTNGNSPHTIEGWVYINSLPTSSRCWMLLLGQTDMANAIPPSQLQTNAFFDFGWELFSDHSDYDHLLGSDGSSYAQANRDRILSDAIPALTLPVGANAVDKFHPQNQDDKNFNMSSPDGVQFSDFQSNWPSSRSTGGEALKWHHSDFDYIAYSFTYKLFKKITTLGNLY